MVSWRELTELSRIVGAKIHQINAPSREDLKKTFLPAFHFRKSFWLKSVWESFNMHLYIFREKNWQWSYALSRKYVTFKTLSDVKMYR